MQERDILDNKINVKINFKDVVKNIVFYYQKLYIYSLRVIALIRPSLAAKFAWKIFTTPNNKKVTHNLHDFNIEQTQLVNIDSNQIQVYRTNITSDRKILLVHGWDNQASHLWRLQKKFTDLGFQVISFDAPAHGNSSGKLLNVVTFAQVIKHLAHIDGEYEAIIGHSMGALASSYAMKSFSEVNTKNIITIGSPNKIATVIHNFVKFLGLSYELELEIIKFAEKKYSIKVNESSIVDFLKDTTANILVVHDEYDKQVPIERAYQITNELRGARLLKTYTLGHNRILKDSATIEQIADFIL